MQHAFRCKNCGRLHPAEHAGDNRIPHACTVCGFGVVFRHSELAALLTKAIKAGDTARALQLADEVGKCDPASKRLVPENWEVLADADDARLKELALTRDKVVHHKPGAKPERTDKPKHVEAFASETMGVGSLMKGKKN